jgi:hypothetical protein
MNFPVPPIAKESKVPHPVYSGESGVFHYVERELYSPIVQLATMF